MTAETLIIRRVRPWGGPERDLHIRDGVFIEPTPSAAHAPASNDPASAAPDSDAPVREIDGRGLLALPGLVNVHAHIDKSWWGKPWQSYAGESTTAGRIAHERARRDELGIPGRAVTDATVRELIRWGTTALRTHVDVDLGIGLRGIEVVRESLAELAPRMRYSIVAFPQDGVLRRPGVDRLLRQAAAAGVEHIGGLDPAGIDRDPAGQLDILFDIAAEHGCGIDIHVHDGGELGIFQMELILQRIKATGLTGTGGAGNVNLAHGFAISDISGSRQADLLAHMAELGVTFTTVAPVGLSPLPMKAMRAAGVAVGLGTDGFRDLWGPYGSGDLMAIAAQHARMTGQRYDEELAFTVRQATSAALAFVGAAQPLPTGESSWELAEQLEQYRAVDFAPGTAADLILLRAENPMDALVRMPRRELVVIGGDILAQAGEVLTGPNEPPVPGIGEPFPTPNTANTEHTPG